MGGAGVLCSAQVREIAVEKSIVDVFNDFTWPFCISNYVDMPPNDPPADARGSAA
jgi:hypothetical protein